MSEVEDGIRTMLRATGRKRVLLLNYGYSAIKGMTHEVRTDDLAGYGLHFGSKKDCLQWIADNQLECTNLSGWLRS